MLDAIPGDKITEFFQTGFQHTAWRLETRRAYAADQRSEAYARFLRGDERQSNPDNPWAVMARDAVALGKRIERVRILDNPLTENQRYSLTSVIDNLASGEDIRFLPRAQAQQLHLPDDDVWLFDSRVAARFCWDETGWATHLELTDDPQTVVNYCQARDAAWHFAIRYEDARAQVASGV